MTDFENLSDDQLRTKLIEHGLPVMPITGTTRKIMIKKLKILQDNRKKQAATERRTLMNYSSDNDSESECKAKPRRATVTPVVKVKDSQTEVNGQESVRSRKTLEKKTKVVKVQVQHTYSGETGSDTEPEVVYAATKKGASVSMQKNGMDYERKEDTDENSLGVNMSSFSNASSNTSCSVDSPPKLFTMAPKRHTPSLQRPEPLIPTVTSAYAAFQSPISLGQQATSTPGEEYEDCPKPRSRYSHYGYVNRNGDDLGLDDAPYLQNFSKRLSMLTQQAKDVDRGQRLKRVERQESNAPAAGDASNNLFARAKQSIAKLLRRDAKKRSTMNTYCRTTSGPVKSEENGGNFVSLALVAAVGVFFVILVALYYGMHRGSNTNEIIGLKVPYCTSTVTTNCLTQEEAMGGTDLYKIFKPKLIELAIDYQCGDLLKSPGNANNMKKRTFYMTDNDIVHFIKHNYKIQDDEAIRDDIDSFVTIAHHNQFLGVSVIMVDENSKDDGYLLIEDVKQANQDLDRGLYIRAFAVLAPTLPWRCSFWQKVSALVKAVTVILSVAAVLHLMKFSYKRFKHYQRKRKEEIMMLVEKILEVMQTQSGDDQYLVINHVRDMIIPIDSRKRMEATWKKALVFIEENESRIRAEVQIVKGESYEVWRWIGGQNVSMNSSSASANKTWQGQAFEVQTPPCSPTPCLKIRGMIDDADRNCNKATIREAILSKCAQSRLLHLAVDANAKCVYLKCADANDAGIAYRSLHGHWFAGHLVTVKYLRLERYMQRFPDSPVSGPPFLKV